MIKPWVSLVRFTHIIRIYRSLKRTVVGKILGSISQRDREALEEHYRKKYELKLGRSTQSRKILCLSDMHCGSRHAICTEDPDCVNSYKPTKSQNLFREHWYAVRDWAGKTNIIHLNGEPFNGPNVKQNGDENWTSKMDEQVREAYRLLKVFQNKMLIITKGSDYHVKRDNTNYEEMLADRLTALPYNAYDMDERFKIKKGQKIAKMDTYRGSRVDVFATYTVNGVTLNFTHHLGFSVRYYYRATALSAEMAQMEFDRGYYYPENCGLRVIGRGHVHYTLFLKYPSSMGFVTPGWQKPYERIFRHGMGGTRPQIGASLLTIEQNGETNYDDLIMKKTFPRPYIPDLTSASKWD